MAHGETLRNLTNTRSNGREQQSGEQSKERKLSVQIIFDNAYAASAASTVCLRMVWQLGFHAIRDGRLLIVLTLDRPLFFSKPSNNGEYLLSFIFRLFGYAMDLFIIWQWPIALTIGLLEV